MNQTIDYTLSNTLQSVQSCKPVGLARVNQGANYGHLTDVRRFNFPSRNELSFRMSKFLFRARFPP